MNGCREGKEGQMDSIMEVEQNDEWMTNKGRIDERKRRGG